MKRVRHLTELTACFFAPPFVAVFKEGRNSALHFHSSRLNAVELPRTSKISVSEIWCAEAALCMSLKDDGWKLHAYSVQ